MNENVPLSLFGGFGVELEYAIVDVESLSVRAIADELLCTAAGDLSGEVDRGEIGWSNELVAHVVELKVNEPAAIASEALPAAAMHQKSTSARSIRC